MKTFALVGAVICLVALTVSLFIFSINVARKEGGWVVIAETYFKNEGGQALDLANAYAIKMYSSGGRGIVVKIYSDSKAGVLGVLVTVEERVK